MSGLIRLSGAPTSLGYLPRFFLRSDRVSSSRPRRFWRAYAGSSRSCSTAHGNVQPHSGKDLLIGKKLLLGVGILVVTAGLLLTAFNASANRDWQAYMAELRASGEPLNFDEIEARRSRPPDGAPTAAHVIKQVTEGIEAVPGPISRGVLGMNRELKIDFFAGIPSQAIQTTRDYMATRRPVLEELSEIATLEPGRFAISYDGRGYEMMTRFQEESHS